jgi:polyhydroxybutyrate depolymerase
MKRVSLLLLVACTSAQPAPPAAEEEVEKTFGGSRPVTVRVPEGYDAKKPAPLVIMLHGYGSAGRLTDIYWKMSSVADKHGFFYVAPDGLQDKTGKRFWNANPNCCDYEKTGVDDVAYITSLVDEIKASYTIDPRRIYVLGHSNGGHMAHRLACERADLFGAAVGLAGVVWGDTSKCNPTSPVGILQIHGTKDETVLYDGEGDMQPSAEKTVAIWAKKNHCAEQPKDGGTLHVDMDGKGEETKITRHEGCKDNGAAELWRVEGGTHLFVFTPESLERIWQFLESHAKR